MKKNITNFVAGKKAKNITTVNEDFFGVYIGIGKDLDIQLLLMFHAIF